MNDKKKIKDRAILPSILDYEEGKLDLDQTVELFQALIDTRIIYQLQGSYQRQAQTFIDDGLCTP